MAESFLDSSVPVCDSWLADHSSTQLEIKDVRDGYLCLILESERINRLSPWKTSDSNERLKKLTESLQSYSLPLKEKLYAEGRIYSSLPALYGGDLKRAIIALETLKRLESDPKKTEPWIQRVRKLQGKFAGDEDSRDLPLYRRRRETDGLPIGLVPVLFGNFPQGIGAQMRGQDYGLFDTARRVQGRVFATHRGSVGGEVRYEDYEIFPALRSLFQLSYLHGIQEHHGLGLDSPKNSVDLYIDRGTVDIALQKNFFEGFYLKLGWRFQSSHLREVRGGIVEAGLEGLSNAFDTGLVFEAGFDSRDSEVEPFHGQRVYLQSYVPRITLGSSRNFERFLGIAESYWLLNLQTQLKLQGVYCSVSDTAPFSWFSQLSGTVALPGLRPTRFVDRSLLAMTSELRWKKFNPVTVFGFGNVASMAGSTDQLISQRSRWGGGLGGEIHLTRFRTRAFRIEAGNFGGEWNFNSMIGVALD